MDKGSNKKQDLFVKNISFNNFRNIRQLNIKDISYLTIITGPNAVGKTNLIEGLQLLSALHSFRHPLTQQLINSSCSQAYISLLAESSTRQLSLALSLEDNKKKYTLNNKKKKISELKGLIPSVTFTPDDISLVKGPASLRRSALDVLGSQLSSQYYLVMKDYEKVIKYKNMLLKDNISLTYLKSINETLVTCGSQLAFYRLALLKKIIPFINNAYDLIADKEPLKISYTPSWVPYDSTNSTIHSFTKEEAISHLKENLNKESKQECARHKALVGPHADHLDFFLNGYQASLYGSQGQQRSIVLAFKIAEGRLIKELCNQQPLFLLDDVMSELDEARRYALLNTLESESQTFITTTNLGYFSKDILKNAQIHVMNP